jgi:hypothetical protein
MFGLSSNARLNSSIASLRRYRQCHLRRTLDDQKSCAKSRPAFLAALWYDGPASIELSEERLDVQLIESTAEDTLKPAAPKRRRGRSKEELDIARAARTPGLKHSRRSRVATGKSLIPGVSGNSFWVRRVREIMSDMVQDLGGPGEVSANEKNLIRRAATLTIEAERLEKRFALSDAADPDDIDVYGRITGHLRRTLDAIGMKRRPRQVGESLGDLMKADLQAQREKAEQGEVVDVIAGVDQVEGAGLVELATSGTSVKPE